MRLPTLLSLSLLLGSVLALPQTQQTQAQPKKYSNKCTTPAKRVEWRQMTSADQKSYLDSVLCLKTKPSRINLTTSLYDDFPYVHFNLSKQIHGCAAFLPWHRYFTTIYHSALRTECGYTGPMTFWDWTQDNLALLKSPVMSATAFGGQGSSTRTETYRDDGSTLKCVSDGAFKNLRPSWLAISPTEVTKTNKGHCMFRNVVDGKDDPNAVLMAQGYNASNVARIQKEEYFGSFAQMLEGGPHGVIHASLGGEMNPTTSPNEPLFFLHHPQIDRIWWQWQQKNLTERRDEYFGDKLDEYGYSAGPASLTDVLKMNGLAPDITVKEIMDTSDPRWCYKY